MKLKFMGNVSDAQVNWGGNDDPRGLLAEGACYEVANVDIRSSHTKITLTDFPNKVFNSVHFVEVKE